MSGHIVKPLALLLAALLGGALAGCDSGTVLPPPPPAGEPVVVFVVWGSSNARGRGDQALSPLPPEGTAFEWAPNYAAAQPLEDPVLSAGTGSAWPAFAIAYYGATASPVFVASAAVSGSLVIPEPALEGRYWYPGGPLGAEGLLYRTGVDRIGEALGEARRLFPNVAFGGVLWNQGNDFKSVYRGEQTLDDYEEGLAALLSAFGDEVVEGDSAVGGRFYLLQALDPLPDRDFPTPGPLSDSLRAVEVRVCERFAYCTMGARLSESIRSLYDACPTDECRALYYRDSIHWGQEGLNLVGREAGESAAAFAPDP